MVEPHSSNFGVITTNVLSVRIFRKFTVVQTSIFGHLILMSPMTLKIDSSHQPLTICFPHPSDVSLIPVMYPCEFDQNVPISSLHGAQTRSYTYANRIRTKNNVPHPPLQLRRGWECVCVCVCGGSLTI